MRIAIYLRNQGIANIDCSDLLKGNPGIGGTEYCMLLLAQLYKESYPLDEIHLLVSSNSRLPAVDAVWEVADVFAAAEKAKGLDADVFLCSAVDQGNPLPKSFFERVDQLELNTVTWGHNFYLSDFCDRLAGCKHLRANVFVGRQQYDRYLDHKVIHKSTYIYNMYPEATHPGRTEIQAPVVTYIGSLVPMKGFHILADAWKQILAEVPDAQLMVIGSGKLYGQDAQLGKYGIAEASYENSFMPGLLDEKGAMLPSVHFLGVMGSEKADVIARTSVGVVNPSGRTETFGISALDFESLGVPVVTIGKGGFLDTIVDGQTGILYQDPARIAHCVTELLTDQQKNLMYGNNGRKHAEKFLPQSLIGQWHDLFHRVAQGDTPEFHAPESFMNTNLKWLRWKNRKLKDALKVEYPISVIGMETIARKVLRVFGK